jgi:hypothetical protein
MLAYPISRYERDPIISSFVYGTISRTFILAEPLVRPTDYRLWWTVAIPPQQIKALYGLGDDVISIKAMGNNTTQKRWKIWDDEVCENNFQMNVIHN